MSGHNICFYTKIGKIFPVIPFLFLGRRTCKYLKLFLTEWKEITLQRNVLIYTLNIVLPHDNCITISVFNILLCLQYKKYKVMKYL